MMERSSRAGSRKCHYTFPSCPKSLFIIQPQEHSSQGRGAALHIFKRKKTNLRCRQKYLEPTENSWILLLLLRVEVKLYK